MQTPVKEVTMKTAIVTSKDGATLTYDKAGNGPAIIVVNGALSHRQYAGAKELTEKLGANFTVIFYDRRGRGASTDKQPYAVEREIEDIDALITAAGGTAYLFGSSSGAALALLAAEKLGPTRVAKLALYEPPYGSDTKEAYAKEKNQVTALVSAGKPAEAVAFFMERRGIPADKMEEMKKSPEWGKMVKMGHTLSYDFEVTGDGSIPVGVAKNITVPTLVVDGEKSFDFVHATADSIGKVIPGAERRTLKGQGHNAGAAELAPVLIEFYRVRQ